MPLTRDNHYVPQLYLKHFAAKDGFIQRYRFLTSRESVRPWKKVHVAGVAYQQHLYTRLTASGETDEIETWLNREYETPAAASIAKVVNDERLEKADYRLLVRFLASQIVRTPAFLIKHLPRWKAEAEQQLRKMMDQLPQLLEQREVTGGLSRKTRMAHSDYMPIKVAKEPDAEGKMTQIRVQSVVGRGYWFFVMRHLLDKTWERLLLHKWTILVAPEDLPWFTTDDPVVCLNFHNVRNFDFGGGWASPGTEFILPLSPKHLLYTQVARKTPQRGTVVPVHQAEVLRSVLAQHAFRYIFSPVADKSIEVLRPQIVNSSAVQNDIDQWRRWNDMQSNAERELLG